jgi:H+/Cl- antiporter ClcA
MNLTNIIIGAIIAFAAFKALQHKFPRNPVLKFVAVVIGFVVSLVAAIVGGVIGGTMGGSTSRGTQPRVLRHHRYFDRWEVPGQNANLADYDR